MDNKFKPTGIWKPVEQPQSVQETKLSLEGNHWVLPTDFEAIDQAEDEFRRRLLEAGWESDGTYIIMDVAFREALANALVHGNLGIAKPREGKQWTEEAVEALEKNPALKNKKIIVDIDIQEKSLFIRIEDEGKGFVVEKVPDPTRPGNMMKTKGRGLLFMEKAFDTVEYVGRGNIVTMSKERRQ